MYSTQFTVFSGTIFCLAVTLLSMLMIVCSLGSIKKAYFSYNSIIIFLVLFSISIAAIAAVWDPAPEYDSYRHFQLLDEIRNSHLSFIGFLFNKAEVGGFPELFCFNVIRYVYVCLFTGNKGFVFLCTLFDYLVFTYIFSKYNKSNSYSFECIVATLFFVFGFMPYLMVVSGIRNALATAIISLAIFRRLYEKKPLLEFLILGIIAITIHPVVIIPFAFVFVYRFFNSKFRIMLLVGIGPAFSFIYYFLSPVIPYQK